MRRIFLDEFLNQPDRGAKFYDKVLAEYGDDSVAELGQVQIAIEGVSNVAIQTIEDRRIGLSFLEKSSRYVSWESKPYKYYFGKDMESSPFADAYRESCEMSFDTYVKSLKIMIPYLYEIHKIESYSFHDSNSDADAPFSKLRDSSDIARANRIYRRTIKAKALDTVRGLLPASTLTNVGIAGNGRAFEYLVSVMKSSRLPEIQELGDSILHSIRKVMGPFMKRADDKYGNELQQYLNTIKTWKPPVMKREAPWEPINLIQCENETDSLDNIMAGLFHENGNRSFSTTLHNVKRMSLNEKKNILEHFISIRQNRRHRLPRAFELVSYTFEIISNFGVFRDIHRHRTLTMQRQDLSTNYGFTMPALIEKAGLNKEWLECMRHTRTTYQDMVGIIPEQAQYVVNFAHNYPYMMKVNLRELCHMIELRTIPQGHPDYRHIMQNMYEQVQERHPLLSRMIKFVNMSDNDLNRLESEKRTNEKIQNITM